jgi:hypothetical protein
MRLWPCIDVTAGVSCLQIACQVCKSGLLKGSMARTTAECIEDSRRMLQ